MSDKAASGNIFGSDQNQQNQQATTPAKDQTVDEVVATLVGEGRKYKSVKDLATAYMKADEFIETLKGENLGLREKLASAKTVDEVLTRLQQGQTAATNDKGETRQTPSVSVSAEAIAKIVRETVTGMETEATRAANLAKADAEMRKAFGEKAQEAFAQVADTPEKKAAFKALASVDPAQFLKLFRQGDKPQGGGADSGGTINSAALGDAQASYRVSDAGCKEYYDNMRRKEPRKYYSQDVQLAMNRAAQADSAKFFGKSS